MFSDILGDLVTAIVEGLIWLVQWTAYWSTNLALNICQPFFEWIFGAFPSLATYIDPIFAQTSRLLGIANFFFPVYETIQIGAALGAYRITLVAVRWVLKAIPTVG